MLLSQLPHCLPQVVSPTGMIQYVFFTNCLARYLTLHSGYLKMGHLTEGVGVVKFFPKLPFPTVALRVWVQGLG